MSSAALLLYRELPATNHPKDILHGKNHLYGIIHRMIRLKQGNIFRWLDIDFFNVKT